VPAATTVSSVAGGSLSIDDLLSAISACGSAFQNPQRSKFMMHPSVWWSTVRKAKAGSGSYLVQSFDGALTAFGFEVILNEHMSASPSVTGERVVLFGAFDRFAIVETPVLLRIDEETYAEKDQIRFMAEQRADAAVIAAGDVPFTCVQIS
jgi:HK97 family phage major capsid protein